MECGKRESESCFKSLAGLENVFDPFARAKPAQKKHPCDDCASCQFCSDARCQRCRADSCRRSSEPARKLSIREQIELYERINAGSSGDSPRDRAENAS